MSRVVGGAALLGVREREVLRRQIIGVAEFCGVEVLTYCVMSNHFHVLVGVPESAGIEDAELVRRVRLLYPEGKSKAWEGLLNGEREEERDWARERLLKRMGDVSGYMKELKQRFSIWYNRTHGRYGTLWAERFKSVLVEKGSRAVLTVACYIDLNPVRAGLCDDPKDYRYCGYGEAMGGSGRARGGLMRVLGSKEWKEALKEYRLILYGKGYLSAAGERGGVSAGRFRSVRDRAGEAPLPELLRCRVRYFTDGVALGSREYLERLFRENRELFGKRRKSGARRPRAVALEPFCVMRDLRREVFG